MVHLPTISLIQWWCYNVNVLKIFFKNCIFSIRSIVCNLHFQVSALHYILLISCWWTLQISLFTRMPAAINSLSAHGKVSQWVLKNYCCFLLTRHHFIPLRGCICAAVLSDRVSEMLWDCLHFASESAAPSLKTFIDRRVFGFSAAPKRRGSFPW